MDCETAESDLPLMQAEQMGDGEEPPPLLPFNATYGCALSSRTRITTEIGPQSGTIPPYSYTESCTAARWDDHAPMDSAVPAIRWNIGVCKCWGSEPFDLAQDRRRLSSEAYRNQASGFTNNPLGLDTSLRSYSTGVGLGLFPMLPDFYMHLWNIGQPPGVTQPEKLATMTSVGGPFLF